MIYCFTGTGNSGYVARRIAERIDSGITWVYECIRDDVPFGPAEGETLVFVTPTHAWRIPRTVEKWISESSELKGNKAYFVMTCGSDIGNADKFCAELCERVGMEYMGVGGIEMPENYVAMFPVPDEAEAKDIVRAAIPAMDAFAEYILSGKIFPKKWKGPLASFKSGITNDFFYKFCVKADKFRVLDTCVGCGKCATVCITHNIKLVDGRPQWGNDCIHCMRCICDCGKQAIEYGRASVGKPRYHCPEI